MYQLRERWPRQVKGNDTKSVVPSFHRGPPVVGEILTQCEHSKALELERMASGGGGDSKQSNVMINDPPTDGISCVCFAPSTNLLLASSWDSVSIADLTEKTHSD